MFFAKLDALWADAWSWPGRELIETCGRCGPRSAEGLWKIGRPPSRTWGRSIR